MLLRPQRKQVRDDVVKGIHMTGTEGYLWLKCKGCSGEVGIPTDLNEPTVECPQCGQSVQVRGRVLYRPASQGELTTHGPTNSVAPTSSSPSLILKTPSLG